MYSKRGMPTDSKESLLRSIALKPGDAYAHLNLGNQEVALGDKESAMSHFKQVRASKLGRRIIAPLSNNIMNTTSRQAHACSPHDASLALNLAYALIDNHHAADAIAYLKKALEIDPGDEDAKLCLEQVEGEVDQRMRLEREVEEMEAKVKTDEVSFRACVALLL